jgi:hypothetical protein
VKSYGIDQKRLDKDFVYHSPKDDQPERYTAIRELAKHFATGVMDMVPPGREQALALTKIEEACFWANASIARNE